MRTGSPAAYDLVEWKRNTSFVGLSLEGVPGLDGGPSIEIPDNGVLGEGKTGTIELVDKAAPGLVLFNGDASVPPFSMGKYAETGLDRGRGRVGGPLMDRDCDSRGSTGGGED